MYELFLAGLQYSEVVEEGVEGLIAPLRGGQGGFKDSVRSGARAPAQGSVADRAWGRMELAEQLDSGPPDYGANELLGDDKTKIQKQAFSLPVDEDAFITSLDAKLKDLEQDMEAKKKKKRQQRSISLDSRPMFITTVKTGIFLEPPPELAALLGYSRSYNVSSGSTASQKSGEDLMYSFSSQPRVLNNSRPKPKVNNEKQQQVNLEKQKAKSNIRSRRDISNANHNNNNNSNNNNNTVIKKK